MRHRLGLGASDPIHFRVIKRSLDARRKIVYRLRIQVSTDGPLEVDPIEPNIQPLESSSESVHIIGAGPAGLFAALQCLEMGLRPVVYERGKDVRARRRDIAKLNKEHIVDPESNYCFGEGGAGAYSDGKLYTRSKKRGDVQKILETLVLHGAARDILIDAHPHIGTNKLPGIITAIRETILDHGGEIHFNARLTDIIIRDQQVQAILINGDQEIAVDQLILATGHSARDIFTLCRERDIRIENKDFALGVRVEHPQELVDRMQYGKSTRPDILPPASYNLVCQVGDTGVFSFCMCPGG
ncbi:MAG: FAD-binding protein, partial [Flavobacteriales bacterium]|nr:FAD-binding protein [Flavobacteriales bacterium]